MSKKTLGLDIGTNSIGWALVDEEVSLDKILDCGVYIFPEGVKIEKGVESSKAAERTKYRSARRLRFRRNLRKYETLKVLIANNMCPLSVNELELWRQKKIYPSSPEFISWYRTDEGSSWEPYALRKKCAEKTVSLQEAGRALYHIAQRRGFLSNRKEGTKESEGKVSESISELNQKKGDVTLGQYFYEQKIKGVRVRNQYTARKEHYIAEFEKIAQVQNFSTELRDNLYKAIFFQRKLRSQKFLVGKCTLEPKKSRCPVSHIDFEEFRMLSFINTIKVARNETEEEKREKESLTAEEKKLIIPLFFRVSKDAFEFKDITKILRGKKHEFWDFNYPVFTQVSGCPVSAGFRNIFGESWCEVKIGAYDRDSLWHVLFDFDDHEKLESFAREKLGFDEENAKKFAKIKIPQGYANLSLKAIHKILVFLREGYLYSHAVFFANIPFLIGFERFFTDKEKIVHDIQQLIDSKEGKNQIVCITNSCIESFFKEQKSVLPDSVPSELIERQLYDFFGKKNWQGKTVEEQHRIEKEIAGKVNEAVQIARTKNPADVMYNSVRLDDEIETYLKLNYGYEKTRYKKLYHPSDIEQFKAQEKNGIKILGSPKTSSVKNPVAMRALHSLRKLLNYLLLEKTIDSSTRINIELANEVNDKNKRAAIKYFQNDNEKRNQEYRQRIIEHFAAQNIGYEPTDDDIKKYRLWQEQKEECLYTGKKINLTDLFGENPQFDFEHTIPRSVSFDDSLMNLTLCDSRFNREVKKQQIPSQLPDYDEIVHRVNRCYENEIDRLLKIIEHNSKSGFYQSQEDKDKRITARNKAKLELDYYKGKLRRFTLEDVGGGFKNSQLNDTRLITKTALQYLKTVFSAVVPIKGEMTALLRKQWGIQQTPEKDRSLHSHHAKDAIVIACVKRGRYNLLCELARKHDYYKKMTIPRPWEKFAEDIEAKTERIFPKLTFTDNALKHTKKILRDRDGKAVLRDGKNMYIQGATARGSLHQDTFYGCITDPRKESETYRTPVYVIKKPISLIDEKEAEKIIDDRIKRIFFDNLRNGIQSLAEIQKTGLLLPFKNNGNDVYVKKIRIKAKTSNPIPLKAHRDKSIKSYKQSYFVCNDENYLLSIYRGTDSKGKEISDFRLLNLLDAVQKKQKREVLIAEKVEKNGIQCDLYKSLKIGKTVLLQKNYEEDVWSFDEKNLWTRYYRIAGIGISGKRVLISFAHAYTSLPYEYDINKSLDEFSFFRRFQSNQIICLVEDIDFKVLPTGKIVKLERNCKMNKKDII